MYKETMKHRNKRQRDKVMRIEKKKKIKRYKQQRYKDKKILRNKGTKITDIEKYKDKKIQMKRFNDTNCLRRQFSHHTDTTCPWVLSLESVVGWF